MRYIISSILSFSDTEILFINLKFESYTNQKISVVLHFSRDTPKNIFTVYSLINLLLLLVYGNWFIICLFHSLDSKLL